MGNKSGDVVANLASHSAEGDWYQYGFWDKEMHTYRGQLTAVLILPLVYTTLLMWICLSIFWGSLVSNNDITKIKISVANFDIGGSLGAAVVNGIRASSIANPDQLDWQFDSSLRSTIDCQNAILEESVWAVLQG